MRKMLFFIAIAGLFFSCQREEEASSFTSDTTISVLPNTKAEVSTNNDAFLGLVAFTGKTDISAEEAQATALATAMQMRKVEGIVTKAPLQIGSVEVVKGDTRKPYVATKGSKPEPADVYIINFANNQGYVVTSGDRRVPGVLAYNSYGHLGDTISNPGQAVLFSYMQAYIEEQREAFEANKEKLITQAEEALFKKLSKERQAELIAKGYFDKEGKRVKSKIDIGFIDYILPGLCNADESSFEKNRPLTEEEKRNLRTEVTYGEWRTEYVKAPLLKTLWGQSEEYNDKVAVYCEADGDQAPVGCVATAIGQLMAYHKKPAVFKDRVMHWDDMTKIDAGDMFSNIYSYSIQNNPTAKEDIQHLLARLGDNDLLSMEYGSIKGGGSSSNINEAERTLKRLGYSAHRPRIDKRFRWQYIISEIKNNRPVYIRGCLTEENWRALGLTFWTNYKKCHAWLLDGYVERTRKCTTYVNCGAYENLFDTTEKLELVHQNFGWGEYYARRDGAAADNTGWYHIGIFDTKGYKEPSNTYKGGEDNYQYDIKIMINIQ